MPCAYWYWDESRRPCQFEVPEDELMEADGEKWCVFHAPLVDKNGKPTEKGEYDNSAMLSFYAQISKRHETALKERKTLNLRGVVFPGTAHFGREEFLPHTDFSYARFGGNADFQEAEFKGSVHFQHTQFQREAKFQGAEFSYDVIFHSAEFQQRVFFQCAKFDGRAFFQNAKFRRRANFQNTEFRHDADFDKAVFRWGATFLNAQFNERGNFRKARFKEAVNFGCSGNEGEADAFQGGVDFGGAEFKGSANFDNRKFQQATSFRNCFFQKAPRFHGCRLHQGTDFAGARFSDTGGDEAASSYRTLKLDMEEKRARQEQLMFYALEMRSRRRAERRKLLKFLSGLYEATSDYGQSIISPFASVLMIYALSMIIYSIFFILLPMANLENKDILLLSARFGLEQVVRPFGALDSPAISQLLGKTASEVPPSSLWLLGLRLVAALQSILSLVFLGLGALAIRWRFKIG